MDWKKEYRLTDLFRRETEAKEPVSQDEPVAEPEAPAAKAEQKQSTMKKEIHLFGRRKAKAAETADDVAAEPSQSPELPADPAAGEDAAAKPVQSAELPPEPAAAVVDETPAPNVVEPEASPEPSAEARAGAPAGEAEQKQSVMKKEIHLFGRRKAKEPEPVEEPAQESTASLEPVETPAAEPEKKSAMKKEIHLFGRRKAKSQPAEEPVADSTPVDGPLAAEERPNEGDAGWSQPESVEHAQGGSHDEPSLAAEADAPVQAQPHDQLEAPDAVEAAAALAAAHAAAQSQADERPDAALEVEPVADSDPAVLPDSESAERSGRRFGRRGRKAEDQGERGGPERREEPSRRERSTEERTERAEARGGKPTALPDVPLFRAINLLPREEAKARRQGPSLQQVSVAVIGLVMLGMLSFVFVLERARVQDRQDEVQQLQAELAALQSPEATEATDSTTEVAGELVTRAGTLSFVLDGRIVWDRMLRQLSLVLPPEVWFDGVTSGEATSTGTADTTSVTDQARASLVTITGYAKTQQGVAELLGRLGVLPEFDLVQLQSGELVDVGTEKVVKFSVSATLKPTGGVAS